MILNTIAEGMSLAKKLENESGSFYEALAKKSAGHRCFPGAG